jgi:phospho-N-acetylmuramoyl-pentapeptide-transferase
LCGLAFGTIGFIDDLLSLLRKRSLGLSPWQKILLVTGISLVLFLAFPQLREIPIQIPFSSLTLSLPAPLSLLLLWGIFLATTNSMNLTDGLDGLATGVSILIIIAYFTIAPALSGITLPLVGILIGFLWMNTHPAQIFLGDVGSFALGGIVAGLAITSGTALILPFIAGLLVLESSSVILQVGYYRLTGKRIFKISPFHHHFEHAEGIDYTYLLPAVEWPEPKIVMRLWIVQAVFIGLGILAVYR